MAGVPLTEEEIDRIRMTQWDDKSCHDKHFPEGAKFKDIFEAMKYYYDCGYEEITPVMSKAINALTCTRQRALRMLKSPKPTTDLEKKDRSGHIHAMMCAFRFGLKCVRSVTKAYETRGFLKPGEKTLIENFYTFCAQSVIGLNMSKSLAKNLERFEINNYKGFNKSDDRYLNIIPDLFIEGDDNYAICKLYKFITDMFSPVGNYINPKPKYKEYKLHVDETKRRAKELLLRFQTKFGKCESTEPLPNLTPTPPEPPFYNSACEYELHTIDKKASEDNVRKINENIEVLVSIIQEYINKDRGYTKITLKDIPDGFELGKFDELLKLHNDYKEEIIKYCTKKESNAKLAEAKHIEIYQARTKAKNDEITRVVNKIRSHIESGKQVIVEYISERKIRLHFSENKEEDECIKLKYEPTEVPYTHQITDANTISIFAAGGAGAGAADVKSVFIKNKEGYIYKIENIERCSGGTARNRTRSKRSKRDTRGSRRKGAASTSTPRNNNDEKSNSRSTKSRNSRQRISGGRRITRRFNRKN